MNPQFNLDSENKLRIRSLSFNIPIEEISKNLGFVPKLK